MKKRRGRKRKIKLDKLLELGERAGKIAAKRYKYIFDSPEDASQEYMLRLLEGKNLRSTVDQTLVDMSRDVIGRAGSKGYEGRKSLRIAIHAEVEPHIDLLSGRRSNRPFDVVDQKLFLQKAMTLLSPQQLFVIERFLRGEKYETIAQEMGLTVGRINQIVAKSIQVMGMFARK